jgi:hypothetical protein
MIDDANQYNTPLFSKMMMISEMRSTINGSIEIECLKKMVRASKLSVRTCTLSSRRINTKSTVAYFDFEVRT